MQSSKRCLILFWPAGLQTTFIETASATITILDHNERTRRREIARLLRCLVVFESSCFANQQYDVQQMAASFENAASEIDGEAAAEERVEAKTGSTFSLVAMAFGGKIAGGGVDPATAAESAEVETTAASAHPSAHDEHTSRGPSHPAEPAPVAAMATTATGTPPNARVSVDSAGPHHASTTLDAVGSPSPSSGVTSASSMMAAAAAMFSGFGGGRDRHSRSRADTATTHADDTGGRAPSRAGTEAAVSPAPQPTSPPVVPAAGRRATATESRRSMIAMSPGPIEYAVELLFLDGKRLPLSTDDDSRSSAKTPTRGRGSSGSSAVLTVGDDSPALAELASLASAAFGSAAGASTDASLLRDGVICLPLDRLLYSRHALVSTQRLLGRVGRHQRAITRARTGSGVTSEDSDESLVITSTTDAAVMAAAAAEAPTAASSTGASATTTPARSRGATVEQVDAEALDHAEARAEAAALAASNLPPWVRVMSLRGIRVLVDDGSNPGAALALTPSGGSEAGAGFDDRGSSSAAAVALGSRPVPLLGMVWRTLLNTRDGVERLVAALDDRRTRRRELSAPAWGALSALLLCALTYCSKHDALEHALSIMVLANTFFTVSRAPPGSGGGTVASEDDDTPEGFAKIFLRAAVRRHMMWRREAFWRAALFRQVGGEMDKVPREGSSSARQEAEVTFGQLGFFAYNMVSFGLASDCVEPILRTYAKFASVAEDDWARLGSTIEGFRLEIDLNRERELPHDLEVATEAALVSIGPLTTDELDDFQELARSLSGIPSAKLEGDAVEPPAVDRHDVTPSDAGELASDS